MCSSDSFREMSDAPPSPCIRNCCLDKEDNCLGCFRSIEEILQWGKATTSIKEKRQILANAAKRKSKTS